MILVECPRDAMQGWPHFIPTATKVAYLNHLLKVGFDILDFGSFVSPKAIPQLADTKQVIPQLDLSDTKSKLLAIVANTRGAEEAVVYDEITYLGFPFSISETFQMRNTNKTIEQSLAQVEEIQNLCVNNNKKAMLYISMGFGNPYGDPYNADIVFRWFHKLVDLGVSHIALADTVGVANEENIKYIFQQLIPEFPNMHIGAHFHSNPATAREKLKAAYDSGCRSFDSSIKGIGGCPMAEDKLVGNIATEELLAFAKESSISLSLDEEAFATAAAMASSVFI
ncbi:MAG TPA: hydroxymethylglutaryl-CoA lyase [Edaphocola sp.]|nr:hydroxymethylglutaryl-CoA lyase [Edaphocola sp.]